MYSGGMQLPPSVRRAFQRQGRRGGRERARRLAPDIRRAIARRAAVRRWTRVRFGAPCFAELGLPGGALIDRGLDDLAAERETVASLVVSLAAPRLRREGVPVPSTCFAEADHRLYRALAKTEHALAHARYLAHLRQAASFADACHVVRKPKQVDAR